MTVAGEDAAYDTITNHVLTNWSTYAAGILTSGVPELRFADVEKDDIPNGYFVRFSMQPVTQRQATLRNGEDQRYRSQGVVYLQVFSLRSDELYGERGRKLADAGRKLFRGKSLDGCIWFRNVRVNRLEPEPKFGRYNVVAEYEYDEIG